MVTKAFHRDSKFKRTASVSLLVLVCTCLPLLGQAADALSLVEQSLFFHDYAGEPMAGRLDRLESSVFGAPQVGTDAERSGRLLQVLNGAKNVVPSVPKAQVSEHAQGPSSGITRFNAPEGNTQSDYPGNTSNSAYNPNTQTVDGLGDSQNPQPIAGDSDYPTVMALEREVFSRDFLRDDISRRLDRLEARAFGQPSPNLALVDRVDRLLARYPHAAGQVATYSGASNASSNSALRDLPSDSRAFVGHMDTYTKVGVLEKRLFNGRTYDGELLTQRLYRLESKSYGRDYSGQSIDTRVNRLLSAYKTPTQHSLTTNRPLLTQPDPAKWRSPSQVGYTGSFLSPAARSPGTGGRGYSTGTNGTPYPSGDTPLPNSNGSGYLAPVQPNSASQNIQIGGGFNSASSTSTHFSPEMLAMLPPGVQQQLGGSTMQQQSSTTIMGAPGTVITQETTTYPGFQTYGGPPITTYNYFGNPAVTSSNAQIDPTGTMQLPTQSTITVIQPNGMPSIIQNPAYPNGSGTLNGLPTPVYVGDPAILNGLNNLEMNLYGQVNPIESVPVRLSKLETVILGQVYMGYPDDQRLGQLQKAYQIQSVGRLLGKSKAANIGRTAGSMLFGVPMNTPTTPMPLISPTPTTK